MDRRRRSSNLRQFEGQPLVLAFLPAFEPTWAGDGVVEAARAELRGLGATLLVVSPKKSWCIRPDDDPEVHDVGDPARLRGRFGVPADAAAAVLVLDGEQGVRFGYVAETASEAGATFSTVVSALGVAGRELAAGRGARWLPSRREVVVSTLAGAVGMLLADGCATPPAPAARAAPAAAAAGDDGTGEREITLEINGTPRKVRVDPRVTLLDALRERLGLPGTKKGCDQGQCGACTVLVGERRVNACLTLAVMAEGSPITTIEGIAGAAGGLHALQSAFIEEDAFQCGYCTSGQIVSAAGLLAEGRAKSDDEVREQMSGNLCRCGAYPNIVAAIQRARGTGGGASG